MRVKNDTDSDTIIHWHGLTPPFGQDGVAMYGQPAIPPGGTLDYDFANTRAGTHWMHSHMGLQEQQLLAAPLIVQEVKEPLFDDQELDSRASTATIYWEGAVRVVAEQGGTAPSGKGYLELTGYWKPMKL